MIAARRERDELAAAIQQTLDENGHLADGDVCTLKVLKDALSKVSAGGTVTEGPNINSTAPLVQCSMQTCNVTF